MDHDKMRFWEMSMMSAIISMSEANKIMGPAMVSEKAAKIADAATDEMQKRVDAGQFVDKRRYQDDKNPAYAGTSPNVNFGAGGGSGNYGPSVGVGGASSGVR